MSTAFYKLSGAGNDFIALVDGDPSAKDVRAWCRRGISVGADGVLAVRRADGRIRLSHWNADGIRSRLCLNGSRCAAQLAFHLGWSKDDLILETDAGPLAAHRLDDENVALLLPSIVTEAQPTRLEIDGRSFEAWTARVGVPHLVLFGWDDLAAAPVEKLGPALRRHPDLGPSGANVNFAMVTDRHRVALRTWERGVESETLACGTGIIATVAAGLCNGTLALPAKAKVAGGFVLQVSGTTDGNRLKTVSLAGDARVVARGDLLDAAAISV